jgi:hypothetical protein
VTPTTQDPLRNETRTARCAGPGCANLIAPNTRGRPTTHCSPACRVRHHRQRQRVAAAPVTVEVDMGSSTSRGRPAQHAWLVRIRRDQRAVIVNTSLTRPAADHLADQLAHLLTDPPPTTGAAID